MSGPGRPGPQGRGRIKHGNGGFSLLELVIVIVIISVLMVLAISRLLALMVDAERTAMETVAGTLRSAIGMKVAESIVKSKVKDLPAFEGSNPMALLAETPHNYLGELDGADPASSRTVTGISTSRTGRWSTWSATRVFSVAG
jgi:prepilin-type N-terminal cleavage/methylation domain-containing protein